MQAIAMCFDKMTRHLLRHVTGNGSNIRRGHHDKRGLGLGMGPRNCLDVADLSLPTFSFFFFAKEC